VAAGNLLRALYERSLGDEMFMRWFRCLFFVSASTTGGCYYFQDFSSTPIYHVPAGEVINSVRGEIVDFLCGYQNRAGGANFFELDPDGVMTVTLTLNMVAHAEVNYSKIRTEGLHMQNVIAIGAGAFSNPFPQLDLQAESTTMAKLIFSISQAPPKGGCLIKAEERTGKRDYLVSDLRLKKWLVHYFDNLNTVVSRDYEACTKPTVAAASKCTVSLGTQTLQTKFNVVGEVQAGVISLKKLIPIVAVPNVDIKSNYYHQIDIQFVGLDHVALAAAAKKIGATRVDNSTVHVLKEITDLKNATLLLPR
jgi:hypothetical protein